MTKRKRSDIVLSLAVAAMTGLVLLPAAAHAVPINLVVNGDFNANYWNSNQGTSPDGWESNPPLSGTAPGNYGQDSSDPLWTPGLTSVAAHLQDRDGNYYQQTLANQGVHVDAGARPGYNVKFDVAYRDDSSTSGDIYLRVALWDTTADTELTGQTLTLVDPGSRDGPGLQPVHLNDDPVHLRSDRPGWSRSGRAVYLRGHECRCPWQPGMEGHRHARQRRRDARAGDAGRDGVWRPGRARQAKTPLS